MDRQTITYGGFKFHRYPNAKISSDRNYYKGWVKENGVWKKKSLHIFKYSQEVGLIPKGYSVHHSDTDFNNNEITNYEIMLRGKHTQHHYDISSQEYKDANTEKLIKFAIPASKAWHRSEEGRKWHSKHLTETLHGEEQTGICTECNKEFKTDLRKVPKYCNVKCKNRAVTRKFRNDKRYFADRVCQRCGEIFSVNKWGKNKFCSRECTKGRQIK